jgi:hypothetical protein
MLFWYIFTSNDYQETIIDIACTFAVIWFVLFMLFMYLYGEGLVSCKNLFPIQLYIYIDNKIIIKSKTLDETDWSPKAALGAHDKGLPFLNIYEYSIF